MTYAQIKQLALKQLDGDPHDMDEYADLLGTYVNEGYQIAVNDHLYPREKFTIQTDKDGRADISGLGIRYIPDAVTEQGYSAWARLTNMGDTIETAVKDGKVILTAVVTYPGMESETDVPRIPEFAHGALADYACFRYLSNGNMGKQAKANFYYGQFARQMSRIEPQAMRSVTNYRNLYTVTDARWTR